LAYKQKKRFDESGEESAWQYALIQAMALMRELSAAARREITEADVRMAANAAWSAMGGDDKYREAFGDALWLMWQEFVRGNQRAMRSGLIAPRAGMRSSDIN